jgi:hypothetical protein
MFDASSMIYAWDNYPIEQFPGLWEWMEHQISSGLLAMPSVAFDEVDKKTPECGAWLKSVQLGIHEIDNAILREALRMKSLLGIVGDKYGAGVGENDLLIIATAFVSGTELVTDESRQNNLPTSLLKYKIPAVCSLPAVSVPCINFIEYIKRSQHVFR